MIDAEVYMDRLLTQSYDALAPQSDPRPSIKPDVDVDQLDDLPAIVWHLTGSGQTANGDGLWDYSLTVNIFGDGMDQAKAAMKTLYDVVHAWNDFPARTVIDIDGEPVWVSSVEDNDLPSRFPSAVIDGRHVVQYSGIFPLALRG